MTDNPDTRSTEAQRRSNSTLLRSTRGNGPSDLAESGRALDSQFRNTSTRDSTSLQRSDDTDHRSPSPNLPASGISQSVRHIQERRKQRSHRSRASGGFLLSNALYDVSSPEPSRDSGRKRSRKPIDLHEEKTSKSISNRSHPVAVSGLNVDHDRSVISPRDDRLSQGWLSASSTDAATHIQDMQPDTMISRRQSASGSDIDPTQIVNMALNLSESRRLGSKRATSNPMPPTLVPMPDSSAGGSLKQHLQQQRRASRNVSPRPERGLTPRAMSSSKISSPLQAAFDTEGSYTYHFSQSTLNRAQNAKEQLELMAQYRRLLDVVPPLKPGASVRTALSSPPSSPLLDRSSQRSPRSNQDPSLGRPYNPLQYIRNRKVRARERKAIDGEALGFSDVDKVTAWVDEASKGTTDDDSQTAFKNVLPPFSGVDDATQQSSSPSKTAGQVTKPRRPRLDWMIEPADMIADVYWLEQDDNKALIEDRHYRRIFPPSAGASRPLPSQIGESHMKPRISATIDSESVRNSLDADAIDRTPPRIDADAHNLSTRDRARQKLHEIRGLHHRHNSSVHSHHDFLRLRRQSLSDDSDNDSDRKRRVRSGTISASGNDLLEKQMQDMISKEQSDQWQTTRRAVSDQTPTSSTSLMTPERIAKPLDGPSGKRTPLTETPETPEHPRSDEPKLRSPMRSNRPSLEVPVRGYRGSTDFDRSAPTSPVLGSVRHTSFRASGRSTEFSPSSSRPSSPNRNPFSKVKNIFRERSRERTMDRVSDEKLGSAASLAEHADALVLSTEVPAPRRPSSRSPERKIISTKTGESQKSHHSMGSLKLRSEEQLGLRNILKGGARIDSIVRGGVSKVTDLLWKKDSDTTGEGITSSEESDLERARGRDKDSAVPSRAPSRQRYDHQAGKSFLDVMPSFTSAAEAHDKVHGHEPSTRLIPVNISRPASRRSSRFEELKPPRLEVPSATGSPRNSLLPRGPRRSDFALDASRRTSAGSYGSVRAADARLNAILSMPTVDMSHRRASTAHIRGRHWSISDQSTTAPRAQISKREVARLRALVLTSGVKAMEIARRAHQPHSLFDPKAASASGLSVAEMERFASSTSDLERVRLSLVPQTELYVATADLLKSNIEASEAAFNSKADLFVNHTIPDITYRVESVRHRLITDLGEMSRRAADEADEVSRDLVVGQTLKVKRVMDTIEKMSRRRRRRFRWVRRAGWLAVEWALVGFMWWVWFVVVILRIFLGVGRGALGVIRWLFWL